MDRSSFRSTAILKIFIPEINLPLHLAPVQTSPTTPCGASPLPSPPREAAPLPPAPLLTLLPALLPAPAAHDVAVAVGLESTTPTKLPTPHHPTASNNIEAQHITDFRLEIKCMTHLWVYYKSFTIWQLFF